jgi:hypothetical protein
LGTIANLEQHTRRESKFMDAHDAALVQALGKPLPPEAAPSAVYSGPSRLSVPTVRTVIQPGEGLALRILVIASQPARTVEVKSRALGTGAWKALRASNEGRAVWQARLPESLDDFEYSIEAELADGTHLRWPVTAPELNQTVVVAPRRDS